MDDFGALCKLFSSRVRTKLLKFFLLSPESSHYIRELARKTGEDAKNISRELSNLEKIGLLESEKKGLQKFYAVREDFLFFPELRAVFLKSSGMEGLIRETLAGLTGFKWAAMKESPSAEEGERGQIRLLFVGDPDRTELNGLVNGLMDKSGREVVYRCYTEEEFGERRKMGDTYVLDVSYGEKIAGKKHES